MVGSSSLTTAMVSSTAACSSSSFTHNNGATTAFISFSKCCCYTDIYSCTWNSSSSSPSWCDLVHHAVVFQPLFPISSTLNISSQTPELETSFAAANASTSPTVINNALDTYYKSINAKTSAYGAPYNSGGKKNVSGKISGA